MMYWILLVMGAIVSVTTAVIVGGFLVPSTYTVRRRVALRATPEATRTALEELASWTVWMELTKTPRALASSADTLTVSIDNDDRVAVATVQFTLEPHAIDSLAVGTQVTATESGAVTNPVVRLLRHYVTGHHAMSTAMLTALAESLGEAGAPIADGA